MPNFEKKVTNIMYMGNLKKKISRDEISQNIINLLNHLGVQVNHSHVTIVTKK